MHVSILGPLQVRDEQGNAVTVSGTRLRILLVRLALDAGHTVPEDSLVDAVWGGSPPSAQANALQSLVSRLRRALSGGGAVVRSPAGGYRLAIDPEQVDAHRFTALAGHGRTLLAAGEPTAAADSLTEALTLWQGPALADAADVLFAAGPAARLEEQRLAAREDRAEALLRCSRAAEALADLEQQCTENPLRERPHAQLIRALAACGRRAEALEVYRRLREQLQEHLGLDPSAQVADLHLRVLRGTEPAPGGPGPTAAPAAHPARSTPHAAPTAPRPVPPSPPHTGDAPHGGTDTPAATVGTSAPGNLPIRRTSFVGRDQDVARIAEHLTDTRLVSLVGPGGAGKTRLAIESGTRLRTGMPGGVWFVELAPVHDPAALPQTVLGALGRRWVGVLETPTPVSGQAPVDHLTRIVEALDTDLPTLIVLDNCEHLVEAAASLADRLLCEVPRLRIIATTREPLGVDGEQLLPLGPLRLPPPGTPHDQALEYASVRLFTDRARSVRPDLTLGGTVTSSVTEICRRLDGMPLAIELAAARTRALTPAQIAERLDDRFRLLTGGSRSALPRHQTLRAVVEWSWDLLEERERAAMRRLSVFAGGACLDAAEAVLAGPGGPHREEVLDVLSGLVDKSLVEAVGTDEPRYRMLETIQVYAADRLRESDEESEVRERHLAYLVELTETADPLLRGRDQLLWINRLGAEHDNFGVALRYAVDHDRVDPAVRIVAGLGWYWVMRGNYVDGNAWLTEALEVEEVARRSTVSDVTYAVAHLLFALYAIGVGEVPRALRAFARARLRVRHSGVGLGDHPALMLIDTLRAAFANDYDGALETLHEGARHPDPWIQASAAMMRGFVQVNSGRADEALASMRTARHMFEQIGDRWGLASATTGLAELYQFRGENQAALEMVEEAVRLLTQISAHEDVPHLLLRRANLMIRLGDPDGAWREAEAILRGLGDGSAAASGAFFGHLGMADLARHLGRLDEAREHFAIAESHLERLQTLPPQARAMAALGQSRLALAQNQPARAREKLDRALRHAVGSKDMPVIATCAEVAAACELAVGAPTRAAVLLGASQALRGHADLGDLDVRETRSRIVAAVGTATFTRYYDEGAALEQPSALELLDRHLA